MPRSSDQSPARAHPPHHRHQDVGAVDHRRVDDLALSGGLALPQSRQDADDQEHRAAAEVAGQVERRNGAPVLVADRVQQAVEEM